MRRAIAILVLVLVAMALVHTARAARPESSGARLAPAVRITRAAPVEIGTALRIERGER